MVLTRIFAAVGQFPQDDAVLARALELATPLGATLTIIHVIDLPDCKADFSDQETLQGQAAIAARDRITAALLRLGARASSAEIRIEAGSAGLKLIDICQEAKPDLVVMRAHQKTRFAERMLGSTTDRLCAAAVAPILVVKRPINRPYARVLLATNGADNALAALTLVEALLPTASLHLVQAVEIAPQLQEAMLRVGTDQTALAAYRDALIQVARNDLRDLSAQAAGRTTRAVLYGDPATALVRATRRPKVDLMAVGPGRPSLIRRLFIGSVTRRLLRDAACDVLICHQRQER